MKQELIYIAGPYSHEHHNIVEMNVSIAIAAGLEILKKGHVPYIPHLTHLVDEYASYHGMDITWDEYMAWHDPFRKMCDSLYFIGKSKGAVIECDKSWNEGKKIYYSLDDIESVDE